MAEQKAGEKFLSYLNENAKPQDSYDWVLPASKVKAFWKQEGLTDVEIDKFTGLLGEMNTGSIRRNGDILESKINDGKKDKITAEDAAKLKVEGKYVLPGGAGQAEITSKNAKISQNIQDRSKVIVKTPAHTINMKLKSTMDKDVVEEMEAKFKEYNAPFMPDWIKK